MKVRNCFWGIPSEVVPVRLYDRAEDVDQRVDVKACAEPGIVREADQSKSSDVAKHLENNQDDVKSDSGTLPAISVDPRVIGVLGYEEVVGHLSRHN